jgi:hypothetical protein
VVENMANKLAILYAIHMILFYNLTSIPESLKAISEEEAEYVRIIAYPMYAITLVSFLLVLQTDPGKAPKYTY